MASGRQPGNLDEASGRAVWYVIAEDARRQTGGSKTPNATELHSPPVAGRWRASVRPPYRDAVHNTAAKVEVNKITNPRPTPKKAGRIAQVCPLERNQ